MKRLFLVVVSIVFLLSSFTYAQIQVGTQTQTPCRWDSDCRSLDRIVKIDQNLCIGNIKIYRPDHLLFQTTGAPWLTTILVGKNYTDYIQTGYKIEHKCGRSGFCEVSKTDSYADGASEKCQWGCLVTPTEYKGKKYYNFCVCMGGLMPGKPWCDYTRGNDVYNNFKEWTCEVEVRETMLCGYGSRCAVRPEGVGCWPIETASSQSSKDTQYALVIEDMSQPVYVVAIQNGVVVAKKPISNSSAQEYVLNNGPINSSNAYAFAQQTGLTTIAASSNSSTATSSYSASSSTSSSNSSWLSKIAAFFGFGRKTTSTTSASATVSTYNSTYSTSTYASYSSASSTSYSTYSAYPRTYSAYTTASTTYTPTYSTANYSYSTYTNYSYPSSYSYHSSYTNYKPSYTYSNYSSYSYPTYTSTYSNYSAPRYSNYTYSYPNYSYSGYSNYSYPSYSNSWSRNS
ncbi:MAG: hypothetical protein QW400_01145 [Candidatus Diapherotrites archaeon]